MVSRACRPKGGWKERIQISPSWDAMHTGMAGLALEGTLHLHSWKTYLPALLCMYFFSLLSQSLGKSHILHFIWVTSNLHKGLKNKNNTKNTQYPLPRVTFCWYFTLFALIEFALSLSHTYFLSIYISVYLCIYLPPYLSICLSICFCCCSCLLLLSESFDSKLPVSRLFTSKLFSVSFLRTGILFCVDQNSCQLH